MILRESPASWLVAMGAFLAGFVVVISAGRFNFGITAQKQAVAAARTSALTGEELAVRYTRLEPLGHGGTSEVMTALGYIRHMANSWVLEHQDRAGPPMVDERFLAFVDSRPGFLTFAEFAVMYEMLYAYRFEGAKRLARIVLSQRPEATLVAYALTFILDRVYGLRPEGGAVLLEATRHRDLPPWVGDLAHRMIRDEPDPSSTDSSKPRSDFMCDFLARVAQPSDYPKLLERCQGIGAKP